MVSKSLKKYKKSRGIKCNHCGNRLPYRCICFKRVSSSSSRLLSSSSAHTSRSSSISSSRTKSVSLNLTSSASSRDSSRSRRDSSSRLSNSSKSRKRTPTPIPKLQTPDQLPRSSSASEKTGPQITDIVTQVSEKSVCATDQSHNDVVINISEPEPRQSSLWWSWGAFLCVLILAVGLTVIVVDCSFSVNCIVRTSGSETTFVEQEPSEYVPPVYNTRIAELRATSRQRARPLSKSAPVNRAFKHFAAGNSTLATVQPNITDPTPATWTTPQQYLTTTSISDTVQQAAAHLDAGDQLPQADNSTETSRLPSSSPRNTSTDETHPRTRSTSRPQWA